ncbi:MAG: YicC/YloC family endoribonuclease [Ignavibacteria bacterium]|jgi:uncharacterized protein (TIGR00255 family)
MTGFGKSEGVYENKHYTIEIRSVNSRFCEISFRYPKNLTPKDLELKEIVRKKLTRGKIFIYVSLNNNGDNKINLSVNKDVVKEYTGILKNIKKAIGSKEKIKIEHLLHFSEVFSAEQSEEINDNEYEFVCTLLKEALDDIIIMKKKEGDFLKNDIFGRLDIIEKDVDDIFEAGKSRLPLVRNKVAERINQFLEDKSILDEKRLELETVLLLEKLDITEECVRLKSHIKYFRDCANSNEYAGRRLNFLIQEFNREINTIASKAMDAEFSQKASYLKEEIEKIREQIQNIE